jgi:magnesium-transporting ATPase (P-type)
MIFADPPLTAVQMLWVNLIMDTFAALALATEPPSDALLDRAPQSRFEKIVNPIMWRNIIGQGVYQIIVLLMMLFFGQSLYSLPFQQSDPFYVDQAYLTANPGTQLALNDATNKTYLYTMVF